jgi:hypothetical protein
LATSPSERRESRRRSHRTTFAGADRRRLVLRRQDGGGFLVGSQRAAAAGGPPAAAAGGAGPRGARAPRRPGRALCALALAPGHRRPGGQPRAEGQDERRGGRDAPIDDAAGGRLRAAALAEVAASLEEAQRGRQRPLQPLRVAAPPGHRAPRQGGHTAGTIH